VWSGQPFDGRGLIEWHPRDVATLIEIWDAKQEAAQEARLAAMRQQLVAGGVPDGGHG
jgi:hypothetical protein